MPVTTISRFDIDCCISSIETSRMSTLEPRVSTATSWMPFAHEAKSDFTNSEVWSFVMRSPISLLMAP